MVGPHQGQPQQLFSLDNAHEWMLIDKPMISLDGAVLPIAMHPVNELCFHYFTTFRCDDTYAHRHMHCISLYCAMFVYVLTYCFFTACEPIRIRMQ